MKYALLFYLITVSLTFFVIRWGYRYECQHVPGITYEKENKVGWFLCMWVPLINIAISILLYIDLTSTYGKKEKEAKANNSAKLGLFELFLDKLFFSNKKSTEANMKNVHSNKENTKVAS